MKSKILIVLLVPVICFGMYARPAANQNTIGGVGSFFTPYIVNTFDFAWRYDVPSNYENDSLRFAAEVHLDGYRNCSTIFYSAGYTWQEIESTLFMFDSFDTGMYYFRISVLQDGKYIELSSSNRMHVQFQLPPWQEHEPGVEYNPLMSNQKTKVSKILIANQISGNGTKELPFIWSGSKLEFMLDFWNDTPVSGAYYWCIERNENAPGSCLMNPHRYMKSQSKSGVLLTAETAVVGTFGDDNWFNEVQSYDFGGELCITSSNYLYKLVIDMYDESGVFSRKEYWLYYKPGEHMDVQIPEQVENLHIF